MDQDKQQSKAIPTPENLPAGVIVSPDTLRAQRVPPGQSRTLKWPILDASGPPRVDLSQWRMEIFGLVGSPLALTLPELQALPVTRVFADFHCVTRWSRLGNIWTGVRVADLLAQAGGVQPQARFVIAHAYDGGWTTNMPLRDFVAEDVLVAWEHDGEPLTLEHGGPVRLIVPRLYAWKSAKWLAGLEFSERDKPGFWERNGYHNHGDPWAEERFGW